ncbi:MAG: diaminopimelate epimerase [Lachnospiraceae bacterium]|nr:diaminopimelate epimerase [Lachnospiraceae bacterium]
MKFIKMHGCGNDYIYVDGAKEHFSPEEKRDLAIRLSDRHFGIGSDGIIFINPSDIADFEMEIYNGDGSRAEMCGNGIRCVGKFVYDNNLTDKTKIDVESFGAVKHLELTVDGGKVSAVRVDMGSPILSAVKIPVSVEGITDGPVIEAPITVDGREYRMTCVSMGNPHAVVFTEGIDTMDLPAIGPKFENHPCFPNRVNTEFVEVIDRGRVKMRVWERGSGETLACGTGCCAVAVASILTGRTDDKIVVEVLGGEICIEWDRTADVVYMTGPAVTVFAGEV